MGHAFSDLAPFLTTYVQPKYPAYFETVDGSRVPLFAPGLVRMFRSLSYTEALALQPHALTVAK